MNCVFCDIAARKIPADIVYESEDFLAFLDSRPLFPGHTLLIPRMHFETLSDLPSAMAAPLMLKMQLLTRAVEQALDAEGTFVAANNRVSQSVPHLHIHIVPRRRGDGLKGFFWPRRGYDNDEAKETTRALLAAKIKEFDR